MCSSGASRLLPTTDKDETSLCALNPSGNTSLIGKVVHWSTLLKAVRAMEDDGILNTRLPRWVWRWRGSAAEDANDRMPRD